MSIDTSDTLYSVSSWKTDNFMFREYDRTYDCAWENKNKNSYERMKKVYDNLVIEAKKFNNDFNEMRVVMKEEFYKSTFPSFLTPDETKYLFKYEGDDNET